nr:MAG TPA: peptidase [Caudoviricetes sp.]
MTRLKIDVLGAKYDVHYRTPNQDAFLHDCDGYCDKTTREIVVKAGDNSSGLGDNDRYLRKVLRHEIIHAFLFESGIAENYRRPEWGHDETMIDWMAYQYPKITKALAETGCLED